VTRDPVLLILYRLAKPAAVLVDRKRIYLTQVRRITWGIQTFSPGAARTPRHPTVTASGTPSGNECPGVGENPSVRLAATVANLPHMGQIVIGLNTEGTNNEQDSLNKARCYRPELIRRIAGYPFRAIPVPCETWEATHGHCRTCRCDET
jgi:hypothetical protein